MTPPKNPAKYEEWRRKNREAQKKRWANPEVRQMKSESVKGEKNPFFGKTHSEETIRKIIEANKLRAFPSEETRQKMREATTGEKNPFFGKKHSDETRKKISEAKKNPSTESRRKMSEAQKRRPPASEEYRQNMTKILNARYADPIHGPEIRKKISEGGKGKTRSDATRKRMSDAVKRRPPVSEETRQKICKAWEHRAPPSEETRRKQSEARKGTKRSLETRRKMSEALKKFFGKPEVRKQMSDSRIKYYIDHCWYGSVMPEAEYCGKFNDDLKERVRAFFGYRCLLCDTPEKGKALAVHHVHNDKEACCAGSPYRSFAPLCPSCHTIVTNNKDQKKWIDYFQDLIDSLYDGHSFYDRDKMAEITGISEWSNEKLALSCARKWIAIRRATPEKNHLQKIS